MKTPIFTLQDAQISFGRKPLFEELNLNIFPKDRICLTGKNGEGKSTILKLITGSYELDDGERWIHPGYSIGYLPQESIAECYDNTTVMEYVLMGLNKVDDSNRYLAEIVIEPLGLNACSQIINLSGGQRRRVSLARSIVASPDILLLDEPTNHLDIEAILWLESYLKGFEGAVLCISHDREFLNNFSNKTFWLDRGELRVMSKSYKFFEDWSCQILEQEQKELENLERKMKLENVWLSQGVTARRKRNQRRLKEFFEMRNKLKGDRSRFKHATSAIQLEKLDKQKASKIAVEFKDVSKAYGSFCILKNYETTILKGDKIGIIGTNGSGKTTFLRMLVGLEEPDNGSVKIGKNIEITYFDQMRSELDPNALIKDILAPSGSDHLLFRGNLLHVAAYLKKFMFDPKLMHAKANILSGGQKNRLLLAKALANPGNFIILDEPTNDLDVETLDMLQEYLAEYEGTAIIVSHDRDFIERTVTKIMSFEGNSIIHEVVGGYQDYLKFKERHESAKRNTGQSDNVEKANSGKNFEKKISKKKLSYKLQREYDLIPKEIKELEVKVAELEELFENPNFYSQSPEGFEENSRKITTLQEEMEVKEARWLEIEDMKSSMEDKG